MVGQVQVLAAIMNDSFKIDKKVFTGQLEEEEMWIGQMTNVDVEEEMWIFCPCPTIVFLPSSLTVTVHVHIVM